MQSEIRIANRQTFSCAIALLLLTANARTDALAAPGQSGELFLAEGVKVGEVTSDSAVLWTRLCQTEACDTAFGLPGVEGQVRVAYQVTDGERRTTAWHAVDPERDYTHQFQLTGLSAGTRCEYVVEARNAGRETSFEGSFATAPAPDQAARVQFVVTTGHKHSTSDDPKLGPKIYSAMSRLKPDFFVHTGDVVYYDNDTPPLATTAPLARLHWRRMYSLPRRVAFHREVASYFIKDDHDLLVNDCWPGQTYGELTFEEGVRLFQEQTPASKLPYRAFRWGRNLQVWLMEGREYRSPNDAPDGPEKTIWGEEQFRWLREGMAASDATFKVLISPTPIVGPDRTNKHDNHANAAFRHEGEKVRRFLSAQPNTFVACGDRHWQYVSVDPKTGIYEYSCGSSTDKHSGGWKKDDKRAEHKFLRVAGGFLSVEVPAARTPVVIFRLHDVEGRVVHQSSHKAIQY